MKEDKDLRSFEVGFVPENYIISKKYRPENLDIPVSDSIPLIDLQNTPLEEILKASQDFGFFQVINHGVPEKTMNDAMNVMEEFFDMPCKDESGIVSNSKNWVYEKSSNLTKEGVRLWRDNLKHPCYPLQKCIPLWPNKPPTYQKVIAAYIVEVHKLSLKIFEMICKGLGLDPGYFNDISEAQFLVANFYPPCPDPSLTLGLLPHRDPSLITVLNQGNSTGLQVLKNGEWINVGVVPNALIINIGNQLEIISNGKLKSVEHRVVTKKHEARRTIATHVNPSPDCIVEPAKALVNELEPPRYKSFRYIDFVERNKVFGDYTKEYTNAFQNVARSS
ncbi:hypothetical protein L6452_04205 [Arctium lappa]|uniref:Uncharacterized protein n=1 Tax=Arctium lappa TaxID=4217 RepID=A0ACB9FPZ2_ARCLA|nr:hypothetical protein L6452_04205 [Arctium lappa]